MNTEETIIAIGANHGGTAVLNTISDQFPGNRAVAFDRNSDISFLGRDTAPWIGGQISGPEGLFYPNRGAFKGKDAVIHMETEVERIDFDGKAVYTRGKDGKSYVQKHDKLILATGSVPLRPEIEGMELDNVQFVKLYQNARDTIEKLKDTSVKRVTVMGAEYVGVELAEASKRNGREVVLIDLADTCLSGYYDKEFPDRVAYDLQEHGVKLAFGEKAVGLEGKRRVERVVTNQGCYETDMVIFGIGLRPNTSLGQGRLKTFGNGAFLMNHRQEISVPEVYVVGDCAMACNNAIQAVNYITPATNAVCSGIITAHNTCGKALESVGVRGSNGISIWGLHMLSTGISLARVKRMRYDATTTDYED